MQKKKYILTIIRARETKTQTLKHWNKAHTLARNEIKYLKPSDKAGEQAAY